MHRSLAAIVCAISLSQPTMSSGTAKGYARVVQEEADARHFDPFTLVSMVHWESRWIASASNGPCMGLGGVCLTNYRCCQSDPDGACCAEKRACLLDGGCNLRAAAAAITANRAYCRRTTGRALFRHWLPSYGGYNEPPSRTCGQMRTARGWTNLPVPPLAMRVMRYRRELIRRCGRR